jgi:hypothetical protein
MQKLAGIITENLNPEEIKQNFRDGVDGFYVFKGGNSFKKGKRFDGEYSQFDPEKAKVVFYNEDPDYDDTEYRTGGYTLARVKDYEEDIYDY